MSGTVGGFAIEGSVGTFGAGFACSGNGDHGGFTDGFDGVGCFDDEEDGIGEAGREGDADLAAGLYVCAGDVGDWVAVATSHLTACGPDGELGVAGFAALPVAAGDAAVTAAIFCD